MHQLAGFRDHLAPEGNQLLGRITGDAIGPDGVVLGVEQRGHRRQLLHRAKHIVEIVPVTVSRTPLKILHLPLSRQATALLRPGQQRLLYQAIVLQKAHKHTAQQPRRCRLGERAIAPHLEALACPPGLSGSPVLTLLSLVQLRYRAGALAQVGLSSAEALEIVEETFGVDHPSLLAFGWTRVVPVCDPLGECLCFIIGNVTPPARAEPR